MLKEARANKLWIYQADGKRWYNPDEFEFVAQDLAATRISPDQIVRQFVLRDPKEGMIERVNYIERIIKEFKGFADRIAHYQLPGK